MEAVSTPADLSNPAEGILLCRIGWSSPHEPRCIPLGSVVSGATVTWVTLLVVSSRRVIGLPGLGLT